MFICIEHYWCIQLCMFKLNAWHSLTAANGHRMSKLDLLIATITKQLIISDFLNRDGVPAEATKGGSGTEQR